MKERPILFSAPMVRAILEGRKTQTRRVMKYQPQRVVVPGIGPMLAIQQPRSENRWLWPNARDEVLASCPYGNPGDRLWVRETHYVEPHPSKYGATREMIPHYWDQAVAATGTVHYRADPMSEWAIDGRHWTPSIHMRREHSRIDLEVTGVRVERLQDISEEDARAEGVEVWQSESPDRVGAPVLRAFRVMWDGGDSFDYVSRQHRGLHSGPGSWDANPWVWVVEFKRVKP